MYIETMCRKQINVNAKNKYTTCMHDGVAMISPCESHQPRILHLLTRNQGTFSESKSICWFINYIYKGLNKMLCTLVD